jgi:hypothetical protein
MELLPKKDLYMIKRLKQREPKVVRRLAGATLVATAVMVGASAPAASAGPAFIPHPAWLIVKSSSRCLTFNTVSSSIWDKLYTSNCVFQGGAWTPQLWDVNPIGGGYYNIVSRSNGQCLDVYAYRQEDAAAVVTWPCIGATNQQWTLEWTNSGGYNLRARHSGKCLLAYDGDPFVGQWGCAGFTGQSWYVQGPPR